MSSVTIIIAAHNAAATIGRAVQSALAERDAAEVIVVDDASTDATITVARAADDGSGRLKILAQSANQGPAAARNRAIAESSAPWLAVLDADDYFLPGRLARLLSFAAKADCVADDLWRVDESAPEGPRASVFGFAADAPPRTIRFAQFVRSNLSRRSAQRGEMGFAKPLMRRAFLDAHSIRYQESLRLGEDYELYARALAAGARFLLVPAQGYVSVMRANSLSGRHSEADLQRLRDTDRAMQSIPRLTADDRAALRAHYLDTDCRLQWRLLINAVKAKDVRAAAACFARPYPVPVYLLARLVEQMVVRAMKKVQKRRDEPA